MFTKKKRVTSIHRFEEPILLAVMEESRVLYNLKRESLCILLSNYDRSQIINNLIVFQSTEEADRLCHLNGWDRRSLRINALELGLKYRQIEVILPALKSLDFDQQADAGSLILDYLKNKTLSIQSEQFIEQLVEIGIDFLTSALLSRTEKMEEVPSKLIVADQKELSLKKDSISSFSSALVEMRNFKFTWKEDLKKKTKTSKVNFPSLFFSTFPISKKKKDRI